MHLHGIKSVAWGRFLLSASSRCGDPDHTTTYIIECLQEAYARYYYDRECQFRHRFSLEWTCPGLFLLCTIEQPDPRFVNHDLIHLKAGEG